MRHPATVLLALGFAGSVALPGAPAATSIGRDADPVVLKGADLPSFLGKGPATIVGFRYQGTWTQVPVQVDERHTIDYGALYDTTLVGYAQQVYSDPQTFAGGDPDPTFDVNDELVFMARDAGERAIGGGTPDPSNIDTGSRREIRITNGALEAWVYLFTSSTLPPSAGEDYVQMQTTFTKGPYLTTYNTRNGPNPENSTVTTASYRVRFSDRWIQNELNVYAGGASGVDILDRHKNLFGPGNCTRSENTFSNGEGGFATFKDGPVRAIRSYFGSNSGPLTHREHVFYERRHDVTTWLRVHPIPGVMDFYDYAPAASGMTYFNDLNTAGVAIDGTPDAVVPGPIIWEMVTGAQGTVVHALWFTTTLSIPHTSYYSDDSTPLVTQCTGDAFEYGASGTRVAQSLPNTDPLGGPHDVFTAHRTLYYEAPNQPASLAATRYPHATTPIATSFPTTVAANTPRVPIALLPNTPNPFAGATVFRFDSGGDAAAVIRVYDIAGRSVRVLPAGPSGEVRWDGRDDGGARVSSGVYFYRLDARGQSLARRMVLLK